MSYLLDTNTVSEPIRVQANAGVLTWMAQQATSEVFLSVITLGEIERGILNAPDPIRRTRLEEWYLNRLQPAYAARILNVTPAVMTAWARMVHQARLSGYTPSPMDALLAATAAAHGLTVVTRNVRDFQPLGVPTLNIWSE